MVTRISDPLLPRSLWQAHASRDSLCFKVRRCCAAVEAKTEMERDDDEDVGSMREHRVLGCQIGLGGRGGGSIARSPAISDLNGLLAGIWP